MRDWYRIGTRRHYVDHIENEYAGRSVQTPTSVVRLKTLNGNGEGPQDDHAAIALAPMRPQSYLSRNELYAAACDYEKACADVDHALTLRPRLPSALNGRCWFGALLDRLDGALGDCEDAVRLIPQSAAFLDSRAFLQFRRDSFEKALADYDAALSIA